MLKYVITWLFMSRMCIGYFLGGTVSWMVLPTNKKVRLTYRLSWEKGSGPCGTSCANTSIGNIGSLATTAISSLKWCADYGNITSTFGNTNYVVTSVSNSSITTLSPWEQGENTLEILPTNPYLSVCLSKIPWVQSGSNHSALLGHMTTWIDTRMRSDTGRPNTSPTSSLPPYIGLAYECTTKVTLAVVDPDGDMVRCRWASSTDCKGACTNLPDNTIWLDEVECMLKIKAYKGAGYEANTTYRLAIVVEDFADGDVMLGSELLQKGRRLSSIPLQVSLRVSATNVSCQTSLQFVRTTPSNYLITSYGPLDLYKKTVVTVPFYMKTDSVRVDFMVSGPMHTVCRREDDDLSTALNRSNVSKVLCKWLPTRQQLGSQQLCVWAVSMHGITSQARCITDIILDVDYCSTIKCGNHSRCVNVFNVPGEKCVCDTGFISANCSVVEQCHDKPCEHNVTCNNTLTGFVCSCPADFTGTKCENKIDHCSLTPCKNNGTCVNSDSLYRCICPAPFTGHNCELSLDNCTSSPCRHNGTCTNTVAGFVCNCKNEYTGTKCDNAVDNCSSLPCQHNGTCINAATSYTCTCSTSYSGYTCQIDSSKTINSEESKSSEALGLTWVILSIAIGSLLILLVIIVTCACIFYKSKKNNPSNEITVHLRTLRKPNNPVPVKIPTLTEGTTPVVPKLVRDNVTAPATVPKLAQDSVTTPAAVPKQHLGTTRITKIGETETRW